MSGVDRMAVIERSAWQCPDCGWVGTYADPMMVQVWCVECFNAGRGQDHLCMRLVPADQLRGAVEALRKISRDGHVFGPRPCGTCREITETLGEPFGCAAYKRRGQ